MNYITKVVHLVFSPASRQGFPLIFSDSFNALLRERNKRGDSRKPERWARTWSFLRSASSRTVLIGPSVFWKSFKFSSSNFARESLTDTVEA